MTSHPMGLQTAHHPVGLLYRTPSCCSSSPETSALAEDLIDALCGLLLLPFTPATALWHIGWLLRQLLPGKPGSPGRLSAPQRGLLESALRLSRQFLMAELNGAHPCFG